jgi:hypothetical protein
MYSQYTANRTDPNKIQVRHGEPHSNFFIIFVFFLKSSVRFDRNELQN